MNKILVTGGAGFIASEMAIKLAQDENNKVVVVDNLVTGNISNLPLDAYDNLSFVKADVCDFDTISSIFYSNNFNYVFHYAALVGVKRTQDNPVMVLRDIEGIKNILNLAKNTSVKRVLYASSSEVYGEPVEFPQNEMTTPLNSKVPYAIVKNVGEAFFRSYQKEFGLEYTIFRFFNTYGNKQSKDFVISKFLERAIHNKDITIYGDGSQSRTFCYIEDNIQATYKAFKEGVHINDTVNIGSNKEINMLDLAKVIIHLTNSDSKIVYLPPLEEGDMKRRLPDITNMERLLGRAPISLGEGLSKMLEIKKAKSI